jgi:hypothetical protein
VLLVGGAEPVVGLNSAVASRDVDEDPPDVHAAVTNPNAITSTRATDLR